MLDINKNNDIIIEYIKRYRESNNIVIRNELIYNCWYSIKNYSKYFYKLYRIFELIDYEAMMIEAFINAIVKFDLSINIKFSSYFYFRAKGIVSTSIRDFVNKQKGMQTISFNNIEYQLDIIDNRIDIENNYILKDMYNREIERYKSILNTIKSKKSKRVFELYYINGLSYNEISQKLDIKSNCVRSLITYFHKRYSLCYNKKS